MLIQKQLLEKLIELASDSAEYLNSGERWITVKPHGDDSKGVHVKVEDGETSKQAVERKFDSKIKDKKAVNREELNKAHQKQIQSLTYKKMDNGSWAFGYDDKYKKVFDTNKMSVKDDWHSLGEQQRFAKEHDVDMQDIREIGTTDGKKRLAVYKDAKKGYKIYALAP